MKIKAIYPTFVHLCFDYLTMKHLPNFITSLNLASGFFSVILALNGDLPAASWLIVLAMIFDFCDGLSARLLKAYSDIGKELDSLADIVSFGLAPAIIIFKSIDNTCGPLYQDGLLTLTGIMPLIYHLVTVLMPVCAALRLARFNIDSAQTMSFKGLPTPANAIAVVSLVLSAAYSDLGILQSVASSPLFLSLYTVALSILMVTRIPLLSLKTKHLRFRGNESRYILVILVIISFLVLGPAAAPLIIPLYLIVSLAGDAMTRQERI
jgi:CDP-diacylglycerol--serine O-phosphatidyltransferase